MKRFLLSLGLVIVLSSLVIPSQAAANSIISLNFASGFTGDYPMTSAMTAGVIPAANWNNFVNLLAASGCGTATDLLDSTGDATTAAVTWQSGGSNEVVTPPTGSSGDITMLETYLNYRYTDSFINAITVSGLPVSSSFDVYVYFDGNNGEFPEPRFAGYSIGSQTYWTNDRGASFSDTFVQAIGTTEATATEDSNYALFSGLTGSEFTLSINAPFRGAVNGIQIVSTSVPEPGTVMLILTALVALGFFRKLKK